MLLNQYNLQEEEIGGLINQIPEIKTPVFETRSYAYVVDDPVLTQPVREI